MRSLWLPLLGGAVFLTLVVSAVWEGSAAAAVGYAVVGALVTWWLSPWQGLGQARHADVVARPPADREVVVYWRPGCTYCARLRARLGRSGRRATWVNIWRDPDAAAFVRSVNGGNETVPTVVLDGEPLTNPDPRRVLARLTAA